MPRVVLSQAAFDDLQRLDEILWRVQDPLHGELLDFIFDALEVLTHQPGIGRPVGHGLRELIISRGHSGWLAKYHWEVEADLVRVLRIRHQRESGYAPEEI